jgi:para-aminobenzoate synthetase/4-amino-4-deoxychorismate lyase
MTGRCPRCAMRLARRARCWAAHALHEVRAVLDAVHAAAQRGHWCVGHVRYEAAPAFDPALQTQAGAADGPLAWFAVYDAPLPWPTERLRHAADPPRRSSGTGGPERAAFDAALAHIQQAISAGELLPGQLHRTAHGRLRQGSAAGAVCRAAARPARRLCGAHRRRAAEQVLSVSPELFFDWQTAPGRRPHPGPPHERHGRARRHARRTTPRRPPTCAHRPRSAPKT